MFFLKVLFVILLALFSLMLMYCRIVSYFVYKPNVMPTDLMYCELFDKNDKNLNAISI